LRITWIGKGESGRRDFLGKPTCDPVLQCEFSLRKSSQNPVPARKLASGYVMVFWRPPDHGSLDAPLPKSRKRRSNIARNIDGFPDSRSASRDREKGNGLDR
jgi:hypothetical protein